MGSSREVSTGRLTAREKMLLEDYRKLSPEDQQLMDELAAAYADMAYVRKQVSRMNFLALSSEVLSRLQRLEQRMASLESQAAV